MATEQPDEWATGQLDLAAYLRRIGYDADLAPTAATLAGLHRAQPPHDTGNSNRNALLRDPDGNLVEIVAKRP